MSDWTLISIPQYNTTWHSRSLYISTISVLYIRYRILISWAVWRLQCSQVTPVDKFIGSNANELLLKMIKCFYYLWLSFVLISQERLAQQISSTETYTWTIRNFPDLVKRHPFGSAFISPCFWLLGYRFCMIAYPNGAHEVQKGFLALYLNLSEEYFNPNLNVISKVSNSEITIKYRWVETPP